MRTRSGASMTSTRWPCTGRPKRSCRNARTRPRSGGHYRQCCGPDRSGPPDRLLGEQMGGRGIHRIAAQRAARRGQPRGHPRRLPLLHQHRHVRRRPHEVPPPAADPRGDRCVHTSARRHRVRSRAAGHASARATGAGSAPAAHTRLRHGHGLPRSQPDHGPLHRSHPAAERRQLSPSPPARVHNGLRDARKGAVMATTDLVLEGGGAKLPGLIGALQSLTAAGYDFHRIAGTSAGAIVGALSAAGLSADRLAQRVLELDFSEFEDLSPAFRFTPWLGKVQGLLFHKGMYLGDALHDFLAEALDGQGVRAWGDLKLADPGSAIPRERSYRLVVIVSDVSRGRMLRLPWDYEDSLGVDADSQSVAEAVCASAASPFFFRPRSLPARPKSAGGSSVLGADGGLLSHFPVDVFDRKDAKPARWPTFGVMLSARHTPAAQWRPNTTTFQYARSLLSTMIN